MFNNIGKISSVIPMLITQHNLFRPMYVLRVLYINILEKVVFFFKNSRFHCFREQKNAIKNVLLKFVFCKKGFNYA